MLNLGVNFDGPQKDWEQRVVHSQSLMQGQSLRFRDEKRRAVARTIVEKPKRKEHDSSGHAKPDLPHSIVGVTPAIYRQRSLR